MVFQKKSSDDQSSSREQNVWNIADQFVYRLILFPLTQCQRYSIISKFGTFDIDEMDMPNPIFTIQRRIDAIKRWELELRTIIRNSYFIMKNPDKERLDEYKKTIEHIRELLPAVSYEAEDQGLNRKSTVINEEHFNACWEALNKIQEELFAPLNNAHLIFRASEEIDLDKIANEIIEGG